MTYLICSDIHGDEKAFKQLLRIKEKLRLDGIISAGDFCPTMSMEADAYNMDFKTVVGNCDRYCTYSLLPDPKNFISFNHYGRKVIVTHGDHYLPSMFDLKEGDIFISGHTHIGYLEKENGIILQAGQGTGEKVLGYLKRKNYRFSPFLFLGRLRYLSSNLLFSLL